MKNKNVKVADWGLLSYEEAWQRQEDYFLKSLPVKRENRKLQYPFPTDNHLFFVTHPPVFTIGKSGKIEHLLLNENELAAKGSLLIKQIVGRHHLPRSRTDRGLPSFGFG